MKNTTMLALAVVLSAGGASAQTMYKCVEDGRTLYQATPCPTSAKQDTLKPQGGRVSAPAPGADVPPQGGRLSAAVPGADVDRVIEFMSTYRACADAVRTWGEEMAAPYEGWRSRNIALVSRVENERLLQARYRERTDAKRNGKAAICRDVALELRGKR